jgi:hypothetical protein
MKNYIRESILILVILISFLIMMSFDTISQAQSYHDFADKRTIFGIPNFFDVTTNVFFAIFGLIGLNFCLRKKPKTALWSWIIFFFGVTIVCLGSGYYHLNPNNNSLFWDRLPMTIGFMGLFIAILSEYVNPNIEKFVLISAILVGFSSVIYWHLIDDLRFYYWIQLIPLLTIPIVMIVFKSKFTHQRYLIYALIFYLLAKITETYDKEIFSFIYHQISGHSLKHILASLGPLYIYFMIKKREVRNNAPYNAFEEIP